MMPTERQSRVQTYFYIKRFFTWVAQLFKSGLFPHTFSIDSKSKVSWWVENLLFSANLNLKKLISVNDTKRKPSLGDYNINSLGLRVIPESEVFDHTRKQYIHIWLPFTLWRCIAPTIPTRRGHIKCPSAFPTTSRDIHIPPLLFNAKCS